MALNKKDYLSALPIEIITYFTLDCRERRQTRPDQRQVPFIHTKSSSSNSRFGPMASKAKLSLVFFVTLLLVFNTAPPADAKLGHMFRCIPRVSPECIGRGRVSLLS